MKTIEITSGNQKAQFTTKSVTFDGKEFFYAHMTNVINSTERHVYSFTYDGEVKLLPYEEKDAKTLNAIFSQVQKLASQKRPAATPEAPAKAAEPAAPAKAAGPAAPDKTAEPAAPSAEAAPAAEAKTEGSEPGTPAAEPDAKADAPKAAPVRVADAVEKRPKAKAEKKPNADPEIQARRKKSLAVFGILLAVILVCSVACYFILGTPSDPAPANPNGSESQQYDDIDQLIDDLQ